MPPPKRRPWITAAAWLVILVACAFFAFSAAEAGPTNAAAAAETTSEMEARATVGMRRLLPSGPADGQFLDAIDVGSAEHRQRAAVVAGELDGAAAAHKRLAAFDDKARAAGGDVAEVQRVLEDLYPASPPEKETQAQRVARLAETDRALLVARLGWCGRLALAPDGSDATARAILTSQARRTALVNFGLLGAGCLVIPVGLILLVVALVLALKGRLRFRFAVAPDGAVGAETFAAYLGLYVALSYASKAVPPGPWRWTSMLGAQIGSLAALAVPVFRGVSWAELRRRVGLTAGAGLFREILAGVAGWIACTPIVGAGVVVMIALQKALGSGAGEGGHPIVSVLSHADAGDTALILVAATVMAPIVEETMFRGVLYGHLRDTTSRRPRAVSMLASAFVVSLLFAAIHPQGRLGVPVLGALAFSFSLVREWRGSLVASMTMHAITNTLTLVMVRAALS